MRSCRRHVANVAVAEEEARKKKEWEEKNGEEIVQSFKEVLDALANPVEKQE